MANALGLTKYGFKLQFSANGETTTKSYNYVNIANDDADQKAGLLDVFLRGGSGNSGLYAIVNAMGSPYSIVGQSLTQENTVTFT